MPEEETIGLDIEKAEALILFELLSRELERPRYGKFEEVSKNDAELWALNGLLCSLETALSEPFASNYKELIAQAEASLIRRRGKLPRG